MVSRMYRLDSRARSSQAKTQTVMTLPNFTRPERSEELHPSRPRLPDVEMLMDAGGRSRWVHDVPQAG
jgi:hypothetical protein